MTSLNLLTDSLIRAQDAMGQGHRVSLPQLLARLSAAEVLDFPLLRPHQQPAWHAFLVQLAFLALELAGLDQAPTDATDWQTLLRGLTPGHPADEPWQLVVDDWQQPAFLQSPCLPGAAADYQRVLASAQEIDLLITSKNHDEKVGKMARLGAGDADAVVFALVSLQGFAGYLGAGNFNTMRMNGGFGSRSQFRLVFQRGAGPEFLRDLSVLLARAETLRNDEIDQYQIGSALQYRLLWLAPWGAEALQLETVHPLCLEVCRRIRLRWQGDVLQALTASSRSARVDAKLRNGVVLDPWVPLARDDKDGSTRALTAQAASFGYRYLAPILFDAQRYTLPLLALPTPAERSAGVLVAQVLVGGSGKTDGLLRREIPLRGKALRNFADARAELALRARRFIEIAGDLQGKVLRPALLQFIDGSDDPDWKNRDFDKYAAPWVAQFDQRVDAVFFGALFSTLEAELADQAAEAHWLQLLLPQARTLLTAAAEALPSRDRSREFARARAERLFQGGLFKQFRPLLPSSLQPAAALAAEPEPDHVTAA